jgi:predicted nucleic acid-binding protein
MRSVVIDANVFVSFFVERDEAQRSAARALLLAAEEGEVEGIVPQFVVFEIAYVLQSQYGLTGPRLAGVIRAVVTFPGIRIVDDCRWKRVLKVWPDALPGLADAAIVAVAAEHRYDAIATFDRKFANRLERFGVAAYF